MGKEGNPSGTALSGVKAFKPTYMADEETLAPRTSKDSLVLFTVLDRPPASSGLDYMYALANPTTFSESVEPQYSRRPVLGLSHEVVQFIRTASREITMELWVSYHLFLQKGWAPDTVRPLILRNFFQALTMPLKARAAPPRVEVDWPGASLNFVGVASSLSFEYQRFASSGDPLEYSISVTFLEVAGALMTAPKVLLNGIGYTSTEGG